jgi:PPK2 family polyphosphate:nucleotide phosphotransferase
VTDATPIDLAQDIGSVESKRLRKRIHQRLIVKPGAPADLAARDTAWDGSPDFADLSSAELKDVAKEFLAQGVKQLSDAQELLWASDTHSLLVIFQGMDASGKDSTIKHVMSGVNPQGVQVVSFREPTHEELDHDFLWRIGRALPERGRIGIFNRSQYEDVVAVQVHPEWFGRGFRDGGPGLDFWRGRYEDINTFEKHLDREGTRVVKFFLHLSKGEQKKRFLARLDRPAKQWKFRPADIQERAHWDEYARVYEDVITATSTEWAPWYVIPADHKPVMQAMVIGVLLTVISEMGLKWPDVSPEDRARLAEMRAQLAAE